MALTTKEKAEREKLDKKWQESELNNAELFRLVELDRRPNQ